VPQAGTTGTREVQSTEEAYDPRTELKWKLFFTVAGIVWKIALWYFILDAISRKDWPEATCWIAFLIYDRITQEKNT